LNIALGFAAFTKALADWKNFEHCARLSAFTARLRRLYEQSES